MGNQFEDIWVFIKSVKAFNCRFYLLCFIFDPANAAFSSTTLFAKPFLRVFLNADTSPIYLYIVIVKYEYKIYLINFIYFLLYSHLKINVLFQRITGFYFWFFFFFIFCMIIPKKGIFYWHTSTSFVIDCANKHVHNLNCQCIHGVSYPCICVNTKCFSVKKQTKKPNRLD